jgi:hypothetical protein
MPQVGRYRIDIPWAYCLQQTTRFFGVAASNANEQAARRARLFKLIANHGQRFVNITYS